MDLALTVLLAALSVMTLILLASFRHLPLRELKRRAREGDEESKVLFRAAVYSSGLGAMFWLMIGLFSSLFFWSLASITSGWLTVSIGAVFVWTMLVWLPSRWPARLGRRVAVWVAPLLAPVAGYLHAVTNPFLRLFAKYWPGLNHTKLYDTDDFLDLLGAQSSQADSRIQGRDLNMAMRALTLSHMSVRDIMTSVHSGKIVSADDHLGPVLMSELHDSGQAYFPVYEGKKDNIIGIISLEDLAEPGSGQVKSVMRGATSLVHEEDTLAEVLPKVLDARNHFFIALNNFDEYIGIFTEKDILKQIAGDLSPSDPEQQEDLPETDDENAEEGSEAPTGSVESAPEVVE